MDLTELFNQTPTVAAILIIVAWFLKALKSRDCMLRGIAEAMRENARVVGQNSELLRENITLLRSMNGKRGP